MRPRSWPVMAAALFLLAIAGGFLLGRARAGGAAALHGSLIDPPLPSRDFVLASADGPVALSDFRGEIVVLFFGYTSCPDVCPFTLQRLREARERLGPAAEEVQVVFVSVDPDRDTPERVTGYARGFDPGFVGLTGSDEEVAGVASSFGIFYARADGDGQTEADGEYYLVDHTATVLALDREGAVRLLWSGGVTADEMASDLTWLLRN
jgi:protein SCO1